MPVDFLSETTCRTQYQTAPLLLSDVRSQMRLGRKSQQSSQFIHHRHIT